MKATFDKTAAVFSVIAALVGAFAICASIVAENTEFSPIIFSCGVILMGCAIAFRLWGTQKLSN